MRLEDANLGNPCGRFSRPCEDKINIRYRTNSERWNPHAIFGRLYLGGAKRSVMVFDARTTFYWKTVREFITRSILYIYKYIYVRIFMCKICMDLIAAFFHPNNGMINFMTTDLRYELLYLRRRRRRARKQIDPAIERSDERPVRASENTSGVASRNWVIVAVKWNTIMPYNIIYTCVQCNIDGFIT